MITIFKSYSLDLDYVGCVIKLWRVRLADMLHLLEMLQMVGNLD
jgi:hypothetical protein